MKSTGGRITYIIASLCMLPYGFASVFHALRLQPVVSYLLQPVLTWHIACRGTRVGKVSRGSGPTSPYLCALTTNRHLLIVWIEVKAIGPRSSLRGGGDELGNLKLKPMAPIKLHNIKLKHAI